MRLELRITTRRLITRRGARFMLPSFWAPLMERLNQLSWAVAQHMGLVCDELLAVFFALSQFEVMIDHDLR